MPLQIRRGTTAERLSITPLLGELIYDSTSNKIFIGNGTTAGGVDPTVDGLDVDEVIDVVGAALVAGEHSNVNVIYGSEQDAANRIDFEVDLNEYDGIIGATGFKGSLFSESNNIIFNASTGLVTASTVNTAVITSVSSEIDINKSIAVNEKITVNSNVSNVFLDFQRGNLVDDSSLTATPINTQTGTINFQGYDGTQFITGASVIARVGNTVTTGIVPTTVTFSVRENTGIEREALILSSTNTTIMNQRVRIIQDEYSGILPQFAFQQAHENTDSNKFNFFRSRGTSISPTPVASGDDLIDIGVAGWTGSVYSVGSSMSWIVDGAVSPGILPTRFVFRTNDGVSSAVRITVEKTGDILLTGSLLTSSLKGIGYTTGAGGVVIQATSKSTSVELNKVTGEITTNSELLASNTGISFTLTSTSIGINDHIIITHVSGGTLGGYNVTGIALAGSATITLRNISGGDLSESVVLKYTVIKSVIA